MKKLVVLNLGGSIIIPDKIDTSHLKKFKKTILANTKKNKFIIVCGGGSIARKYMNSLKEGGISKEYQGLIGVAATRINARFMAYFFGKNMMDVPHSLSDLKRMIERHNIVFCGGLTYHHESTTDTQTAEIAREFKTSLINLTDVAGLYDKDPKKHKNAKLIPRTSWKKLHEMSTSIKFHPGQHFVIDQKASKIMMDSKIPAYIIGKDMKNLDSLLKGKSFKGTIIEG